MAKEKIYKCRYNHCKHETKDVLASEAVKEGNRYYHKDCYKTKEDINKIVELFSEHVNDEYPIQASQFESDIRIAEQLDKIYFEFGGGGNSFESYTAAWYFGSRHTKLDCLNRGRKGIIITMGDERLNPYIPTTGRYCSLAEVTGDGVQGNIETKDLYGEVSEKFNVYHLDVRHGNRWWDEGEIEKSFKEYLDDEHFRKVTIDSISDEIVDIVLNEAESNTESPVVAPLSSEGITW